MKKLQAIRAILLYNCNHFWKINKILFKLKNNFFSLISFYTQWWILGEASETVVSGPPLFGENTAYSFILLYIFLKITMKLLRKVGNLRTNSSEDIFFGDHYEVGTKSGKYEIDSK